MSRATVIDLLRHGTVDGPPVFRGLQDDRLGSVGWSQMERATRGGSWDGVIASPLARCREFAEKVADNKGISLQIETGFREMDFGDWEGRGAGEILAEAPGPLEAFWRDPQTISPPGGESLPAMQARVTAAWRELCRREAGRRVLLVTHGGVIRLILAEVLGMPLDRLHALNVPPAGLSRVRVFADGNHLLDWHGREGPE